jgi:tetrahydromethanopterin S-methyltransferase subunit E
LQALEYLGKAIRAEPGQMAVWCSLAAAVAARGRLDLQRPLNLLKVAATVVLVSHLIFRELARLMRGAVVAERVALAARRVQAEQVAAEQVAQLLALGQVARPTRVVEVVVALQVADQAALADQES